MIHLANTNPIGTTEEKNEVKDTPKKKKVVQKTAKKWKCFECEYKYVSPIPVLAVEHKCKKPPVPNTQRKGMLPDE